MDTTPRVDSSTLDFDVPGWAFDKVFKHVYVIRRISGGYAKISGIDCDGTGFVKTRDAKKLRATNLEDVPIQAITKNIIMDNVQAAKAPSPVQVSQIISLVDEMSTKVVGQSARQSDVEKKKDSLCESKTSFGAGLRCHLGFA